MLFAKLVQNTLFLLSFNPSDAVDPEVVAYAIKTPSELCSFSKFSAITPLDSLAFLKGLSLQASSITILISFSTSVNAVVILLRGMA